MTCQLQLQLHIKPTNTKVKQVNGFIEKERLDKCLLNSVTNIQPQRRKIFNFIHPEKISPSGIWRNVIPKLQVIRDGLHLRNVNGSSSVWEYHIPLQPLGNIYSYSISN